MSASYAEVRAAYSGTKAAQERYYHLVRFFARPLSFPTAWIALRFGVNPNAVTATCVGMNLAGFVLIATGSRAVMAAGVGVILGALVLDCADGNMARAARLFSPMGGWLEGLGAYVCRIPPGRRDRRVARPPGGRPRNGVAGRPGGRRVACRMGAIAPGTITVSILAAAKVSTAFPQIHREQVVAREGAGWYGALFTIGRNLAFTSGLVLPSTLVARRSELVLGLVALANTDMLVTLLGRCLVLAARAPSVSAGSS